jgi:hypothetical protein
MKVNEALAAVMADVTSVAKTERNSHQNYSFRGIDAVVNAVGPALRKHGVVLLPEVVHMKSEQVSVGRNNTQMRSVMVQVRYTFVGPEGDSVSGVAVGESMDSGDKATPKAMSVALRTFLLQALMLPTDEPDPDSFSYEVAPRMLLDDRSTWPKELTVADAKRLVLAVCGDDKKLATTVWELLNTGEGPYGHDEMVTILDSAKKMAENGEEF